MKMALKEGEKLAGREAKDGFGFLRRLKGG